MATRPRPFLRTMRALRPAFVAAAGVSVAEVAWFGWEAAGFSAYVCVLIAASWWASIDGMEEIVAGVADRLVASLEACPDAEVRRAIAAIEPGLAGIEWDFHEAVVAKLRATRPGVFDDESRYSETTEAPLG